jgi:hypothetical protein
VPAAQVLANSDAAAELFCITFVLNMGVADLAAPALRGDLIEAVNGAAGVTWTAGTNE